MRWKNGPYNRRKQLVCCVVSFVYFNNLRLHEVQVDLVAYFGFDPFGRRFDPIVIDERIDCRQLLLCRFLVTGYIEENDI